MHKRGYSWKRQKHRCIRLGFGKIGTSKKRDNCLKVLGNRGIKNSKKRTRFKLGSSIQTRSDFSESSQDCKLNASKDWNSVWLCKLNCGAFLSTSWLILRNIPLFCIKHRITSTVKTMTIEFLVVAVLKSKRITHSKYVSMITDIMRQLKDKTEF